MYGSTARTGAAARRERNRAEMRASILRVSQQLISEKGAESLTIRGIASVLEYSPGAIYEYFESKDAIIKELYFEGRGGLADALEEARRSVPPGTNSLDVLIRLGNVYRELALSSPEMYLLVFGGTKCPPPDQLIKEFGDTMGGLTTLQEVVRKGIADGVLEDVDALQLSMAMWSAVHGAIHLELTGHLDLAVALESDGQEPGPEVAAAMQERRFTGAVRFFLRGMATDKGRTLLDS